ncbi:MAG: bifunctional phosphopantothenoylcysteine decarboxylase/phosphopantothenate--cysteine ligase CoaBC [Sandaracinaceae bacterium]|nr:bifunctional phosphopantothenoylcysteine decarboxylase/phosphopantothenate--cysteine ligase CoaBC [Sandaracinaceae bacterium]
MLPAVMLSGKRIVVGIGGGIAAFKAVELVRELGRRGAEVRVVMTPAATRFVGPVTFTGLLGRPPVVDLWDPSYAGEVHVELGDWADAMVVAPATMNVLARLAQGQANDALLATLACARGLRLLAPAMHPSMWGQPATQRNVETLRTDGWHFCGPVDGPLANGASGVGRMAEPSVIADALEAALAAHGGAIGAAQATEDLRGLRVLVTAGPTYEDLDPVRFLGNRSSGKMGFALASRARARGAEVLLVSGPVALTDPAGVTTLRVRSAREMHAAVKSEVAKGVDVVIMAAAVADYRPAEQAAEKIKKAGERALELVRNPDILAELGAERAERATAAAHDTEPRSPTPVLIGFALETTDVERYARGKLVSKRCDLIVANEARDGFAGDTNRAHLVSADGVQSLDTMSKAALADRIWDAALRLRSAAQLPTATGN